MKVLHFLTFAELFSFLQKFLRKSLQKCKTGGLGIEAKIVYYNIEEIDN